MVALSLKEEIASGLKSLAMTKKVY